MTLMLTGRYRDRMVGVLSCYDQIVITGTPWLTEPRREDDRTIKGLNFFEHAEQKLLRALQRPEFNVHGMRRANVTSFVLE
jgi:hypothetical protein